MRAPTRILAVCTVFCVAASAACTGTADRNPGPVTLAWQEINLPAPPEGTRIALANAAVCPGPGGRWYLVGGYDLGAATGDAELLGTDDTMDPAVWTSVDGETWTVLPVSAHSYYGVRSLLWDAACRDGTLVAFGGKVGGAHGNPRMASYYAASGDPALTEVDASFELYGGPNATNVGPMTAGPPGFLTVGNRASGAAVWLSPTGEQFEIVEAAPVLSDSRERATWAADAAFLDGAWIVVGSVVLSGRADRDPAAWRSPDGHAWTAMPAESAGDYDELTVVAPVSGSLTAIGNHGATFQAWRLSDGEWHASGRFGDTHVEPRDGRLTSAIPVGLDAADGTLWAVVKAGWAFELWASSDAGTSWRPVAAPIDLPAAAGARVSIVGIPGAGDGPDRVLLIADDGERSHAFVAAANQAGTG